MTKYKQKDSFIIHHDTASIFQELTNEQAGELIKHLIFYSNSLNQNPKEPKKPSGFSSVITLLAHSFEKQLERDFWKYQTVCKRNENNGKKGGRPQKLDKIKTQKNPKKADSDSDSDSDKDNDKDKKDTASGFSFQGSYSEIPNYSTNFNSVELHQIKKSAVKENLTTQKQDGQQNYILNTSKKSGAQHGTSTAVKPCILSKNNATNGVDIDGPAQDQHCGKNADFNEFWKEFCNMCKAKGSTAGEKKPAETEYKKAVKIASHQGIMRTLEAFKDFILLAFENNKHACRWLKNIHWPDFENVIADYKQQTEILKTNLKKQGKPLPIAQKSPEKQQEEVKMKEYIQERRKSVIKHLNGDEVKFMNHIKEVLKSYFQELHKPWIDDFVFSCKDRVAYFGFTEQKHIDTVKRNFEKFEQIITREIASTDLVKEGENLKIELKLID